MAPQQSLRDLDTAYKNFFDDLKGKRPKMGPPRYKSKKDTGQSIRFNTNAFSLQAGGTVYVAKVGNIKETGMDLGLGHFAVLADGNQGQQPMAPAAGGEKAEKDAEGPQSQGERQHNRAKARAGQGRTPARPRGGPAARLAAPAPRT
ncbi:hypothetical protein HEP87_64480 [Streptomyces sp. S1D4-11]